VLYDPSSKPTQGDSQDNSPSNTTNRTRRDAQANPTQEDIGATSPQIPPTGVGGSFRSSLPRGQSAPPLLKYHRRESVDRSSPAYRCQRFHFQSNVNSQESAPFNMHFGWAALTWCAPDISNTSLHNPTS